MANWCFLSGVYMHVSSIMWNVIHPCVLIGAIYYYYMCQCENSDDNGCDKTMTCNFKI